MTDPRQPEVSYAEAEVLLTEALSIALPEDRKKIVFAVYASLSMGTTPDEMVERLVLAPQESSIAYQRGKRDQHAALVKEGWRPPYETGLRGVAARFLRAVNR